MKKFSLIILTLLFVLPFTSCKKFLEVVPKTEMPQHVLFSTEGGFKDALTGAYIQMKSKSAYGEAMTQTTIEWLVSSWDVTANSTPQRIGLFNFADAGVEDSFSNIFEQEYRIISSVNAILAQIDAKKDIFTTPGMYETIKAEALGIRAYCHLDLLRLFGPIPTAPTNGNMLAYVTTLTNTPTTRIPFEAYKAALLKDLTDAEALLKDIDPITKYTLAELKSPSVTGNFNPTDTYLAFRYLRINYYAIKGLQARAYLWFGDKQKAYENAKLVIDAKNADSSPKFRLGTSADMTTQKDYVLTSEHLFGLYDFDMYNKYVVNYSGSGILKKGTAATTINTSLYGNTGTDIREANMWELLTLSNQAKVYVPKKYLPIEKPSGIGQDFKQIPMIRLSEMYLIVSETAPLAEAQTYWATFRTARNITASILPADPAQQQFEVLKEIRKEFYAEGQAFFAYKRINAPKANFLFAPSAATVNYLLPIPKSELVSN
ncbi:MAG TPA: RagB/SusD family nutrient uptake outer membrane protein [Pedobacter sp.]|nr:RagB/SusD family nutrient uptake outer membrane protein [Pedobacter sp.]